MEQFDARRLKKKNKREESIQILLNEKEKTLILEQAAKYQVSASTYIRLKLLGLLREIPENIKNSS